MAFVASLVHSLAWPAAFAVVVIVLRRPIGVVLSRGVRRLRAGPVEVEFDQELAEVREELRRSPELAAEPVALGSVSGELARLAKVSPRTAVLEAYTRIEARLAELLAETDMPEEDWKSLHRRSWAPLARNFGLISDETATAVEGLSVLRNLAAHSPADDISPERARDYLALADAVLYALGAKPGSQAETRR